MKRRYEFPEESGPSKCQRPSQPGGIIWPLETNDTPVTVKSSFSDGVTEPCYAYFPNLPTEILRHIFSRLSTLDLIRASSVCKNWKLVAADSRLWKQMTFDDGTLSTETICRLLKATPQLTSLKVINRNDVTDIIRQICMSNKDLVTLTIESYSDDPYRYHINLNVLHSLPIICTKLENLTIRGVTIYSKKFFQLVGMYLTNLTKANFNVASGALAFLENKCDKLEEVCVPACWSNKISWASEEVFISFISKTSGTLKVLEVGAFGLTDVSMTALATCRNVQTLGLFNAPQISDAGIMNLSRLHNLKSLTITVAHTVTTAGWIALMNQPALSCLKNFVISDCHHFNDIVLDVIVLNCPHIEILKIKKCQGVTYGKILAVLVDFRNMKQFVFEPCTTPFL